MQSRAVEVDALAVAQAAPKEKARTEHIPLLDGGIHTEKTANQLLRNEAVTMSGVHVVAGRLVPDTGYVPFSHGYVGTAQAVQQILFNDSTEVVLLITTQLVYRYNDDVTQWQLVSQDTVRTTTASEVAGSTTFDLNSVANIVLTSYVGITLDNGEQLITQVNNIAGLTITTDDPVPVGRSVANGAEVFVGVQLSGDPTVSQVVVKVFPGNGWVVFSNGIDPVMYYYQGAVTDLPGLPTNTTCAAIEVFHECLLLGNTTENGTHLPHRIRQSDAGDPTGWTPGTNGIAAIYDILDSNDWILVLKNLGPWVICYREGSVVRGSYIGALNQIIWWEYMSQQDGAQSQGAVCDVGAAHVLVGTNNIYRYVGEYDLPSIGDGVFENFLAADGDLYAPSKLTLFTFYVPTLREAWIFYPSTAVGTAPSEPQYPNKMLRYDTTKQAWQERVFHNPFIAAGSYLPQVNITWVTAPGQWDDTIWERPWTSRISMQNVPNVFLCPADLQQLLVYDFTAESDWGFPIDFAIITKQFGDGGEYTRWEHVTFVGTGSVTVEFSEDEGLTWQSLDTVVFNDVFPSARTLWLDRVSTRMQFKLTGTNPDFSLRYADLFGEFESEW